MEVLAHAVAAYAHAPASRDILPEPRRGPVPVAVTRNVGYALKAHNLWYLCVGMYSVQLAFAAQHRVE